MGHLPKPIARNIFFNQQVNQASIGRITEIIIIINENDKEIRQLYAIEGIEYTPKPIKIYIDSYGGSVYQCLGLLSVMEQSNAPIHTIVTGCAMSAGFIMLIAGDRRFAYKHSTPLYHQVSHGFWGKAQDMENDLEEVRRLQKKLEDVVLEKTKISAEKLKETYDTKKDWFMTATEALDLGVVDEILNKVEVATK